ncbi:RIP metalloprotease [Actinobacteria bacterium YIM 96077]|uniref:Zinc metalloprotease n=1 Tax=Phytoactinopolyspora halophila TaxID=1981511 RepID=A0A329R0J7_9ACTN|nr:site-2 protease family protein [Phytoactinopolyspora halophila]AYY12769.1 RIP metalloprotease [Actinobacteria bacterium YIM 96077]RAW16438.1 zinc metalloprotease [Phytoactinopolyspora halophila]
MDWLVIVGILLFALGLILSIALHEVGHLVPAKLFGVKVTQYMVGFGRTVWSRRRGETEYGVKSVPLGGYIRMIGMFPPEPGGDPKRLRKASTGPIQALIEDARKTAGEEIQPGDEERVFYRKPWWKKLIIMLGGPAMNVILALLLAGGVLMTFGNPEKPVLAPTVSEVSECVIPAGAERTACAAEDPPAPAAEAGFEAGDHIVSFDGRPVDSWEEVSGAIRAAGAGTVDVEVERDGERLTLTPDLVRAERPVAGGSDAEEPEYAEVGFLGVRPLIVDYEQEDVTGVAAWSGTFVVRMLDAMAGIPERMGNVWDAAFNGAERDPDTPVSIVGAGRIGGEIVSELAGAERIVTFVMLLATFNMAIAIFNLIPLLPLDGGHAAGAIWEGIKRGVARLVRRPAPRPVDVAKGLPIAYGVAVVLIGMAALLIYADIVSPITLFG